MSLRLLPLLMTPALVAAPPPGMSAAERERHLQSFDQVWTTVQARHWDPTLNGTDWAKAKTDLRPKVEKAASAAEVRQVLQELLARLRQTHFEIVSSEVYEELSGARASTGTPGLDLRILDGRAIVVEVEPGSPAAKAGIQPGWELLQARDKDVPALLARLAPSFKGSTLADLTLSRTALALVSDALDAQVDTTFHNGRGPVKLKLGQQAPRGKRVVFGNMPATSFWLEQKTLPGTVAYLRFNIWMEPELVAEGFRTALQGNPAGVVLDLRGNPGGIGGMAMGAAGWFTAGEGRKLGTMHLKGTTLNFVVFPRPTPCTAPLAILVDGCTASTSEIFAAGMQDLKRARVFGTRTAGAALPSVFERLPNGDGFQYAMANYLSDSGQPLEGRGVTPDEPLSPTRPALLAGQDPVLDRALAWIRTANAPSKE